MERPGRERTSSTTAVPVHGGETRTYGGTVQASHSSYFWDTFLDETSVAFQDNVTTGDPYIDAAVGDACASTRRSTTARPAFPTSCSAATPDCRATRTRSRARVCRTALVDQPRQQASLQVRRSTAATTATRRTTRRTRLGTFVYNSLDDFQNGAPASFTRRLQVNRRLGDDFGSLGVAGDAYRRTQRSAVHLRPAHGRRALPGESGVQPGVDSVFGQRNDAVPRGVYFSPRLRLQLDVRHESADWRLRGRGSAARAVRSAAASASSRICRTRSLIAARGRPDRPSVGGAAVELRRERRCRRSELARLSRRTPA